MPYDFDYSNIKNQLLKSTRGVSFEEIIEAISKGNLLDDINHFSQNKYKNQKILIIKLKNYVWAVPYVTDKKKKVKFLKTIYPSRKLKEKYIK